MEFSPDDSVLIGDLLGTTFRVLRPCKHRLRGSHLSHSGVDEGEAYKGIQDSLRCPPLDQSGIPPGPPRQHVDDLLVPGRTF